MPTLSAGPERRPHLENALISLIYPNAETQIRHENGTDIPNISDQVCRELSLDHLFGMKNRPLSDFFTEDPEVIRYRQDVFADLIRLPGIIETLNRILPILFDITELRRLDREMNASGESYLYSITEIELYVSCVDTLYNGLSPLREQMQAEGLIRLTDYINRIAQGEYYKDLNTRLKALASRIHEVRSITVGVNLDGTLRPVEAGVISINSEPFKSGRLLDKILRFSFRNDATTCIADLTPFGKGQSENRKEALLSAFNGAMEEVFRNSVRSWRAIVGEYVLENTDFILRLLPEIEFLSRSVSLMSQLRDKGCPLAFPELAPTEEKSFSATGLYNPDVALRIREKVVTNDFSFDDRGRIFILSGPNRGGKSVITCALGQAQAMAQLGLPVPAERARLSVTDGIFTHFPEGADDTIDKGRLGEECARLRTIFEQITPYSMILLDESLSSTGAYEASFIASELLAGFSLAGVRGIFSTHLHELAAAAEEINARTRAEGGSPIDTLVAGMEEGQRSFKITRTKPDGKSYARDIANKYGLSFEDIRTVIESKQTENRK